MKRVLSMFMVMAFLCLSAPMFAHADPANSDWNNSWSFQSPAQNSNILARALAMKFVENGGFNFTSNNTNFFNSQQNCQVTGSCFNGTATSIGNNIVIQGNGNGVDADNTGNVSSQNNNGSGSVTQTGGISIGE